MALTIVFGVLVIGGICLLSLGGLELVERLVPSRRCWHRCCGLHLPPMLLALVVIAVWQSFQAANVTVDQRQTLWPRSSGWPIGSLSQKAPTSSNSESPTPRK